MYAHIRVPVVHAVTVTGSVRITNHFFTGFSYRNLREPSGACVWNAASQPSYWRRKYLCLVASVWAPTTGHRKVRLSSRSTSQTCSAILHTPFTFRQLCNCGFQFLRQCAVILFNDTSSTTWSHLRSRSNRSCDFTRICLEDAWNSTGTSRVINCCSKCDVQQTG
jgi:hypothetical protein